MKPPILLTGKTGQIGFELNRLLPGLATVVAPDREQLDLLNPDSIRRAVRETRPTVIVNAAAYTAVDGAENDEKSAHAANAEAPNTKPSTRSPEADVSAAPVVTEATMKLTEPQTRTRP